MQEHKIAIDTAISTGAVTSPLWLEHFQNGVTFVMLIGGVVLLALRITIALKEIKNGRK